MTTAFTGGTQADGFGVVRSLRMYEQIRNGSPEEDLWRAKADAFPALVLIWDSSEPSEPISRAGQRFRENWTLAVVSSRLENDDLRRAEGMSVLQQARGRLVGRPAVAGESVSYPPGIEIGRALRLST